MNFNVTKSVYFAYFVYYLDRCHGDDNFFIHVHDMSPLIKYVIHQTFLSLRHLSQTPNEKPTHDDESSHTCLHWLTPLGERETPLRAYLLSGCLTLWGKWTPISLFIYICILQYHLGRMY